MNFMQYVGHQETVNISAEITKNFFENEKDCNGNQQWCG